MSHQGGLMDRLTKKLCQATVYVGEESKHLIPAELSVGQTRCQRKFNLINYGYTREDIAKAIKRIKKIKT